MTTEHPDTMQTQTVQPRIAAGMPEALSAWMDGDTSLTDEASMFEWDDDASYATWHRYHLIGDVLRTHPSGDHALARSSSHSEALAFARNVVAQAGVKYAGDAPQVPATLAATPMVQPLHSSNAFGEQSKVAANDAVFRWKLAAGFASLAAVAVVVWSIVGGAGGPLQQGAVLASAPAQPDLVRSNQSATTVVTASSETVWVATPQGVVMRDPRLEELMRTHRQTGGGAAFQVPAGFLRAATHDTVQR